MAIWSTALLCNWFHTIRTYPIGALSLPSSMRPEQKLCSSCMHNNSLGFGNTSFGPTAGKVDLHPDRCGFFDRVSQTLSPGAEAGTAAW